MVTVNDIAATEVAKLKRKFMAKGVVKVYINFHKNGHNYVLGFEKGQLLLMKIIRNRGHVIPLNDTMAYAYLSELHSNQEMITSILNMRGDAKGSLKIFDPTAVAQMGGVRR